jgi:hypothetical protein
MNNQIEQASINRIDEYLESFYEDDTEAKVSSSRKILLLVLDFNNIQLILSHDSLMGTLSRTLRDDYKKSMDLCLYLLSSFYVLSNYAEFHSVLLQNQLGDTTMKCIEYQIQRFDLRVAEYQKMLAKVEANPKESKEYKLLREELDKEVKKMNKMIGRQDKVLYICFSILFNLAEDFKIEKKMTKRKIVTHLVKMLERNNIDLLTIALVFLKKLSIFSENKDQMIEDGVVDRLARFFKHTHENLLVLTLQLIINLSFDKKVRDLVDAKGLIPKIVDLLKINQLRLLVLICLYNLSLDDKTRVAFGYIDCMGLIHQLIIHFPEPILGKELAALAINLAASKKNAEIMADGDQLDNLLARAFKFGDILLFKLVRNISQFGQSPDIQESMKAFAPEFIKLMLSKQVNDDLRVEIVGILSNIRLEAEWMQHLRAQPFMNFIQTNLVAGEVEDDILLDTIVLIANICDHDSCLEFLSKNTPIIKILCQIFFDKLEDDEFTLQILYIIYRMLMADLLTDYIIQQSKIVEYCVEAIGDKNPRIRKMVDDILTIVMDYDMMIAEKIKTKKFYLYNKEWIESLEQFEKTMNMNNYPMYNENGLDPRMWDSDSDVE